MQHPTSQSSSPLPVPLLKLFAVAAIILIPWILWLAHSLPVTHMDRRWNWAWGGLDVGELLTLAATAYLGLRKSGWVVVTSAMAGSLLLLDVWFDCVTAQIGSEYASSLVSAIALELPLSILAFWTSYRAGRYYLDTPRRK